MKFLKKKILGDHNVKIILRLWNLVLKKNLFYIVASFTLIIVFSSSDAFSLSLLKRVLDQGFIAKNMSILKIIAFEIIGLFFIKSLSLYFNNYFLSIAGLRSTRDLRVLLFDHLMKQDIQFYEARNSGILMTHVANDTGAADAILRTVFFSFLREFVSAVSMIALMVYQSPRLTLAVVVLGPAIYFPSKYYSKQIRSIFTASVQKTESLFSYLMQIFHNIFILKIYVKEDFEKARSKDVFNNLYNLQRKISRIKSLPRPTIEIITGIAIALVIFYGGMLISENKMTTGEFIVFLTALFAAYRPLKALAGISSEVQTSIISLERIYAILDSTPKITEPKDNKNLVIDQAKIEFKDVSFGYSKTNVIHDLSFSATPKTVTALIGPSGGGKSTIIKLISRFYDVGTGSISIDDQNIKSVTTKSLRANMALVSQDIFLFDDTVANNIAYGVYNKNPWEVPKEDIIEAAKKAAAHDFIMELEKGYDTVIGERGTKLSGGQRQRVSIARAILKNAKILLLDEATSALDTESEKFVQKALEDLMKNCTTIVIAHRLSTITNANKILVIEKGRLIESGNHSELIAKEGRYKYFYDLQFNI